MTEPVICEVVVTAEDASWLVELTRYLVSERLVACGHHVEAIRSVYRWDGVVHDEPEARVSLHTRLSLVERLTDRVRERHPYEVPCVIALPVVAANPDYVAWVVAETTDPA